MDHHPDLCLRPPGTGGPDARLKGFEGSLDVRIAGNLVFDGTTSYVRGDLSEGGRPLPLIPPLRSRLALE